VIENRCVCKKLKKYQIFLKQKWKKNKLRNILLKINCELIKKVKKRFKNSRKDQKIWNWTK